MDMFKRAGLLMVLSLLMVPGVGFAQQTKIGFVNVARLISESPQANTAMGALQEEFAPRQRELVAMQKAFQDRQAQIERDIEVMGPEERRNAERDLRKEERELARSVEELNEDANLRRNEELATLQRELLREVAAYARDTGFDLVVGEGVFYASPAVDITDRIIERLKSGSQLPSTMGN
jgi:outer membrane protein